MEKKMMNDGICLLRLLLAFWVIMCHFFNEGGIFAYFKTFAVPIFMLISFYYTSKYIVSKDSEKIRKKLKRLFIPFWFWGIAYYIILLIFTDTVTVQDLLWQLVTGSSQTINPPLWFMADQIFLVGFLYTIYSLFSERKYANWFCLFLIVCCLSLQYSGVNFEINDKLPWEMKWNVGRFYEVLPYAILGVLLGQIQLQKEIKASVRWGCIFAGFFILLICYRCSIPNGIGFGSEGIEKIVGSVVIFGIAQLVPIYHFQLLEHISQYTLGIYCLHLGVGWIVQALLQAYAIQLRDRYVCILIYGISFGCVVLLSRLPIKNIKNVLC